MKKINKIQLAKHLYAANYVNRLDLGRFVIHFGGRSNELGTFQFAALENLDGDISFDEVRIRISAEKRAELEEVLCALENSITTE